MSPSRNVITGLPVMVLILAAILTSVSCSHKKAEPMSDVRVVSAGDSSLMLEDVLLQIPRGLEPEDSIAMFRTIVETWLRRQVLVSVARKNLGDMTDIDRMVEDYRTDLIVNRYLSLMDDGGRDAGEDAIDAYMREHADSMLLDEPLVKGIFVKVADDDPALNALRGWMRNPDDDAVNHLERSGLRGAMQYEYFLDRWHPWHEVAELVPYRFFDADAFLESTSDFETEYAGSVYIIHISSFLPTGEKMPADYARQQIRAMFRKESVAANRRKIISGIYRREAESGNLRKGIYDPVTGTLSPLPAAASGRRARQASDK